MFNLMKRPDRGGAASIIVAKLKGESHEKPRNSSGDEKEVDYGKLACAEGLLRAVKNDDPQGVIKSLEDFFYLCEDAENDEYSGERDMSEKED